MTNPWCRLYSEFAKDAKVQAMTEAMQRRLIMLFCLECSGELGRLSSEEIAFALHINAEQLIETKEIFLAKGFIDENWKISNWEKRQYKADSSVERVRKYRNTRRGVGLTAGGYSKHRVTVTERDMGRCVYCSSSENLCLDHVLPVNLGGDDSIENLVLACKECNSGKSGRTPEKAGYSWNNKAAEKRWKRWLSQHVTVTVTAPDTDTDTDIDIEKRITKVIPKKKIFERPLDVPEALWDDFLRLRMAKKAPVTATVLKRIRAEAESIGWTIEAAITEMTARGWQGFKADWIRKEQGEKNGRKPTKSERFAASTAEGVAELLAQIAGPKSTRNPSIASTSAPELQRIQHLRQGPGGGQGHPASLCDGAGAAHGGRIHNSVSAMDGKLIDHADPGRHPAPVSGSSEIPHGPETGPGARGTIPPR